MAIKYDPILDALREADTSGSSDTASNLGTGVGVFSYKSSGVFYFNSLADSTTIGVSTASGGNITFNLLSIPSALIPDPLNINNLNVYSTASTNYLNTNYLFTPIAEFDTTYVASGSEPVGSLYWNTDRDTLELLTNSGAVQVGEDLFFHCINQTGSTITKGTAVMYAGALGASGKIKIEPAVADGTYSSIVVLGMTKEDIADGDEGKVLVIGQMDGIDTSVFGVAGQILYIDPATPGALTTTQPSAPNLKYPIAATLDSKNNGNLAVRAIFTPNLDELNDVQIGTKANNDILSYNTTNTRWENKSLATLKTDLDLSGTNTGDVTVTDSSTIDFTLTGQDITGSVIEGGITHNNLGSLQGGTTGEYNHLTNAELAAVQGLSTGYLKLDLSNTPLTGQTLSFNDSNNKVISVSRASSSIGRSLTIQAGGAKAGLTNANGGNINLITGVSTGLGGSDLIINTVTPGTSGTTDRNPTQKMVVKGNGNVGINQIAPAYKLDVGGDARFQSIYTSNLNSAWYGNGSDGAKTFDGITEFPRFATLDTGTYTYTLTRDVYFTEMTVGIGVTVITAGFRIFCTISLINSGIIHNNGYDASGATGGVGGLGGASAFFKNGTNGSAGRTGTTVGNGIAPATVTNFVGGIGGRGGSGYLNLTAYEGIDISAVNAGVPSLKVGGSEVIQNIASFQVSYLASATNANIELTPSTGGGGGAKSAAGTAAGSGGGGGGGGFLYIAARYINNLNIISANGGNGGDAYGTNANLGGGGGGGGGVVGIVTHPSANSTLGTITANGGLGGASVAGTNSTRAVALAGNTVVTTTANTITIIPALHLSKRSLYMVTIVALGTNPSVDNIIADNFYTEAVDWVLYNTIATPTRVLECWYMRWNGSANEAPKIDYQMIEIQLGGTITSARVNIDEIQNVDITSPIAGYAQNSSDSTNNLTVDLGYTPTTGNMVYSVFSRVGGTTPVVGTGNTAVSNLNTLPYLYTEVSTNRQTNNHSWTGATPAAGISIDLQQPPYMEDGANGWKGKVIIFKD